MWSFWIRLSRIQSDQQVLFNGIFISFLYHFYRFNTAGDRIDAIGGTVMTHIRESMQRAENRFDATAAHFARRHPCISLLCTFIGIPAFILGAVYALASVVVCPVAWVCGWM